MSAMLSTCTVMKNIDGAHELCHSGGLGGWGEGNGSGGGEGGLGGGESENARAERVL